MSQAAVPGTTIVSEAVRSRLRSLAGSLGVRHAAKSIGVSASVLAAGIAGLPVRPGSAALLERATANAAERAA